MVHTKGSKLKCRDQEACFEVFETEGPSVQKQPGKTSIKLKLKSPSGFLRVMIYTVVSLSQQHNLNNASKMLVKLLWFIFWLKNCFFFKG